MKKGNIYINNYVFEFGFIANGNDLLYNTYNYIQNGVIMS